MEPQIYLSNRLADLEAGAYQTPQQPSTPPASQSSIPPFYETTICGGITLTAGAGSDWDPLFDVTGTATDRIKFRLATAGGEINQPWIGPTAYRRYKIAWESDSPETILASLSGSRADDTSTSGFVQIKFNGTKYEYEIDAFDAAKTRYVLRLQTARFNQLVISTQYTPNTLVFLTQLWDGRSSRWRDPSDQHGYVRF